MPQLADSRLTDPRWQKPKYLEFTYLIFFSLSLIITVTFIFIPTLFHHHHHHRIQASLRRPNCTCRPRPPQVKFSLERISHVAHLFLGQSWQLSYYLSFRQYWQSSGNMVTIYAHWQSCGTGHRSLPSCHHAVAVQSQQPYQFLTTTKVIQWVAWSDQGLKKWPWFLHFTFHFAPLESVRQAESEATKQMGCGATDVCR